MYRYFEPGNVLINDELAIRLSGCGLALVMSPESRTQVIKVQTRAGAAFYLMPLHLLMSYGDMVLRNCYTV